MEPYDFERRTGPLRGRQLIAVEKKDYSWFFTFEDQISIATEAAWRLIEQGRVLTSSDDDGQKFGLQEPVDVSSRALSSLRGRKVVAATISPQSGDLSIEFSDQAHLQLLQLSSGYESWRLNVQGSEMICTGGGQIVLVQRP